MVNYPVEMRNFADDPDFNSVLVEHRNYLKDFAEQHKDKAARAMLEGLDS